MKKLYRTLLILSVTGSSVAPAYAGYYQGYVVNVMADGGKVLVTLANGSGQSICSAGPKFYLDPNLGCDRAMLTLAISAKLTDKLVYVSGSDNCQSEWPYNNAQQLTAIDLKG